MSSSEQPKRRKGADHFGYGHQVALGKGKDGGSLWHSHGKHYHKPDTFWCGGWGDRTPEELLSECESTLEDLRLYFPELFRSRPHTPAPAITEDDLVKEISDAFDRGYKVGFTEGQTDGTENEKLRVPDIARKAREDVLDKAIKVIRNRIDCIMIAYEGERNEDMTRKPYAMADGMNECVLMLKAMQHDEKQQAGDHHERTAAH